MGVPGHARVGPDFHHGAVRPDAGQGKGSGDIHICRKALGGVKGIALEDAGRGGDGADINLVFLKIRRPGQAARGFAGFDGDTFHIAFRRGAHGIKAKQRAGGHNDPRARGPRPFHQMHARQERADGRRHKNPPGFDGGGGDFLKNRSRRRFHHDIAGGEFSVGDDARRVLEPRHIRGGLGVIPRRGRGQLQARHALVQGARQMQPNRAQACNANRQILRHGSLRSMRGPGHKAK